MITEVPEALAVKNPAGVIQRAWSVFRLPVLHELIRGTIASLEIEPSLVQAQGAPSSSPDPVAEALHVCCDEMREAGGMPGAAAERAQHIVVVRRYMRDEPPAWSAAFTDALQTHRRFATRNLEQAFAHINAA